ncbi:MAG TPA: Ni/Fe hydrogenase [Rhodobacteraceae bacterium]|jgi:urease accessory protein|nr:HupE/UreJ family protein [Paracoccaceae bacterium]HBG98177.1 Ni/Fe hydrogenase [Paracoccaceae bacterium]
MPNLLRRAALGLALFAVALPAAAHTGEGLAGGFVSGFKHPILGWDHVAAMVAVGLWGAFLGRPAIWVLPIVFPLIMAGGAVLGVLGVPIPAVETGIAASAIVLGVLIAIAAKPPLWTSAVIVGIFAIFHGHAHGTELPEAANPAAYAVGFVIATGLLHLAGILLGLLIALPRGSLVIRGGGGLIALAGLGFLTGAL